MLTRLETLKAMGIEVWSLRGEITAVPELTPQKARTPTREAMPIAKVESETAAASDSVATASATPVQPVPKFRLAMLHYGSVGLCLSLAEGAELPRRFCDDVARLMAADVQSVRFQMVQWPMLDTAGIDQSISAARQVVTQKFNVLPAKMIVIGRDVAEYFGPLEKVGDKPTLVGRQSYLLLPSLTELLGSADQKRQLMSVLASWQ